MNLLIGAELIKSCPQGPHSSPARYSLLTHKVLTRTPPFSLFNPPGGPFAARLSTNPPFAAAFLGYKRPGLGRRLNSSLRPYRWYFETKNMPAVTWLYAEQPHPIWSHSCLWTRLWSHFGRDQCSDSPRRLPQRICRQKGRWERRFPGKIRDSSRDCPISKVIPPQPSKALISGVWTSPLLKNTSRRTSQRPDWHRELAIHIWSRGRFAVAGASTIQLLLSFLLLEATCSVDFRSMLPVRSRRLGSFLTHLGLSRRAVRHANSFVPYYSNDGCHHGNKSDGRVVCEPFEWTIPYRKSIRSRPFFAEWLWNSKCREPISMSILD